MASRESIYLDHGATSWPKPPAVAERLSDFLGSLAANAGRSGHQAALASARVVFTCRESLARLLGVADSADLVFTRGATESINLVLKGFLSRGDRVLVSPLEHNALARPLGRMARERDVTYETLPADPLGRVDWDGAGRLPGPPPRLVALAHGSNVNGVVQDLSAARAAFPDTPLLVDAAQTAGVLPIDVGRDGLDFLACSAHKGLLGPTGVGACFLAPRHAVMPLMEGGTGSSSEETEQPCTRPDCYESGTLNLHGIAGLTGALSHLEAHGLTGDHKRTLTSQLVDGLQEVEGVTLHSPRDGTALLLAVTVEGRTTDQVAARLEKEYGILTRPGLQCAPLAHQHLGTFPGGTVRLSPGWGNTVDEMDRVIDGVRAIAKS